MRDNSLAREMADRIEQRSKVKRVLIDFNHKHPQIIWRSPTSGRDRFHACSATPSDHHTYQNAWHQIRRMLLEDGDLLNPTAEDLAKIEAEKEKRRQEAIARRAQELKIKFEEARARYEKAISLQGPSA